MLTIGGRDGNPPGVYGTHIEAQEASYASPDPNAQGLAVFDMTGLTWLAQYTAAAPPYQQSDLVKQFYSDAQQLVRFQVRHIRCLTKGMAEPTMKTLQRASWLFFK